MANYKVFASNDVKQAQGGSAITSTSTVINGGVIKGGGGSNGSKLDVKGWTLEDQSLYGSQIATGTNLAKGTTNGPVANQEVRTFTIQGITQNIATVSSNVLRGGSDPDRDKIANKTAVRTYKVATAVRAGYWNIFTGEFTTPPSTANDVSSFGTDHANSGSSNGRGLLGEGSYAGQSSITNFDYTPPTT